MRTSTLVKRYITNVLNRNDGWIEYLYKDNRSKIDENNLFNIEKMNFTMDTLESSLKTISGELLLGEAYKPYRVAVLLIYCIKIDEYFKKEHIDYETELLIDILVKILMQNNFIIIPRVSYLETILVSIFLLLIIIYI